VTSSGVVQKEQWTFVRADSDVSDGLKVAVMAGAEQGSVHVEVALSRLEPGASIFGHQHFYEESFYILSGEVLVDIDGHRYHLRANDFGFAPMAAAHSWHNQSDEPVEWFRVRSPQPRTVNDSNGSFSVPQLEPPSSGALVGDPRPTVPYVGRFEEHHLPAAGPLAMRGVRGPNVKDVAIWMLVDELIGALHHTMFIVQFRPGATTHPQGDHFHPFEEAYYFIQGSAIAHLEGGDLPVRTGDLVFAGTNAMHGYTMTGDEPVRWIEIQAPAPTPAGAFIFPADWRSDGG